MTLCLLYLVILHNLMPCDDIVFTVSCDTPQSNDWFTCLQFSLGLKTDQNLWQSQMEHIPSGNHPHVKILFFKNLQHVDSILSKCYNHKAAERVETAKHGLGVMALLPRGESNLARLLHNEIL